MGDPEYAVTEKGRCVARELQSDILPSILDQSLACALRYIDFSRRGIEANCTIEPREDGRYDFCCSFEEKRNKIFRISLVVDSLERAKRMKDNFINRPEVIYRGVFALLAGNVNYLLTEEQSIPSIFVINCEQIVNFFACCLDLLENHIFIRQNVQFPKVKIVTIIHENANASATHGK